MASLARLKPNGMADRFEAFFRGVELCNGFGELTDAAEQRRRFERDQAERHAAGAPVYPIDERFLDDLERGMPESGGNALGVDRLLMLLLGADSIQDVMPFPEERL
jgi:lysyl-tRNA synthetase class 2